MCVSSTLYACIFECPALAGRWAIERVRIPLPKKRDLENLDTIQGGCRPCGMLARHQSRVLVLVSSD